MKFIDKFALIPIDRYKLLIKDKNNILEEDDSVNKQKGSGEGEPQPDNPLEKAPKVGEQVSHTPSEFVEKGGGGKVPKERGHISPAPPEKIAEKRGKLRADDAKYEENYSLQSVRKVNKKKHTGNVDVDSDNTEDRKRVKRQRKTTKTEQFPAPPPGTPNRRIQNRFMWLKLF